MIKKKLSIFIIFLVALNIMYAESLIIETESETHTYQLSEINYLDFEDNFINVNLDAETQSFDLNNLISLGFEELTSVEDDGIIAIDELYQNYPNPFNPSTTIRFNLKEDAQINLEIYNVKGQKVRSLYQGKATQGVNEIVWTGKDDFGRDATSGIYFFKLTSPSYNRMKKMILLK